MTSKESNGQLPNWWERENQRRLIRVLLFLVFVISLIAYYYYISANGLTGIVSGVNFDTKNYIAFVRDDGQGHTDLYAVKLDGTGLRRLTSSSDNSNKAQPVWTLDGKSLLYSANLADSRVTQIYLLGDGQPAQLTYGTGNKSCPTVSPDGKHAAFISQGAIKEVYLNGKEVVQLMPQPRSGNDPNATESSPASAGPLGAFLSVAFSKDGTGVAGAQDITDESSSDISDKAGVEMSVTCIPPGGGQTMVLDMGHEVSVAWETNGDRLACSFTELHTSDTPQKEDHNAGYKDWQSLVKTDKATTLVSAIRIFTLSGKKPVAKNVFVGKGYSIEPKNIAWSPDGSRMAFEGWRLMGEGQRELSGIAVEKLDTDPNSQGVMVDPQHLNALPYVVEVSAQGKPQNPRWSPDSMHLLFEMVKPDGKRDLWSINADGTNAVNLTKGVGDNFDGAWSPAQ